MNIDIQTQTNRPTSTKPCHSKMGKKVAIPSGRSKVVLRRILITMLSPEKDEIHPLWIFQENCLHQRISHPDMTHRHYSLMFRLASLRMSRQAK